MIFIGKIYIRQFILAVCCVVFGLSVYIIRKRFSNLISRPGFFGPALRFKPFFGFGPELVGLFTTLK